MMSNQIVRNLLKPVRSCYFSVMCDDYTDVSDKVQLTFCMRWVNNDIEEKFLGFCEFPDIKSSTIVTVMKDISLRYQLNLDMCRDQCCDGASNMLGKSSGVATQIFTEQPKVHYTHCHTHSLSFLIKDVTKNTKILRDTMGNVEEITTLIKYSPK